MYFKETQTSPQGQVHLFPVIMDGRLLYETMMQKIGPKGNAAGFFFFFTVRFHSPRRQQLTLLLIEGTCTIELFRLRMWETQTSPQGQGHLFPVIMDGRLLYETMMQKIGPKVAASFIEVETIHNSLTTVFLAELLEAAKAGRVVNVAALLDQGVRLQCTDK
eukprot:gene35326-45743_t